MTKPTSAVLNCFRELQKLELDDRKPNETERARTERIYAAEQRLAKELHEALVYTCVGY